MYLTLPNIASIFFYSAQAKFSLPIAWNQKSPSSMVNVCFTPYWIAQLALIYYYCYYSLVDLLLLQMFPHNQHRHHHRYGHHYHVYCCYKLARIFSVHTYTPKTARNDNGQEHIFKRWFFYHHAIIVVVFRFFFAICCCCIIY